MDCARSRDTISKAHGSLKSIKEGHIEDAVDHINDCVDCKTWFKENMCPVMQNTPTEEVGMIHGMLHEAFCIDDCISYT